MTFAIRTLGEVETTGMRDDGGVSVLLGGAALRRAKSNSTSTSE